MTQSPAFGRGYAQDAAENYERYFVPAIGAPVAADLLEAAAIRPGERVLDVVRGRPRSGSLAGMGRAGLFELNPI